MGAAEHEVPDAFVEFAENVSAIFQVITFFVFGALIVATGYHGDIWRLVLFILLALLVARPAAIFLAFVNSRLPRAQKMFIAWFGPKGVASMLFALFVLKSHVGDAGPIFDIAAITILCSIVAHGLTDTVGATWIDRRPQR
jgi:NhaP-type Na+/H+ or K+/H+ antiporter